MNTLWCRGRKRRKTKKTKEKRGSRSVHERNREKANVCFESRLNVVGVVLVLAWKFTTDVHNEVRRYWTVTSALCAHSTTQRRRRQLSNEKMKESWPFFSVYFITSPIEPCTSIKYPLFYFFPFRVVLLLGTLHKLRSNGRTPLDGTHHIFSSPSKLPNLHKKKVANVSSNSFLSLVCVFLVHAVVQ